MRILDNIRFLDAFRSSRDNSADEAKERLQIIIARDRFDQSDGPDYLPELKRELLEVIRRYVPIDQDQVKVKMDKEDNCEVLELNIILPEQERSDLPKR